MTLPKNKIILYSLLAIIIFLLFLVFRGCNPAPPSEKTFVDSVLSENQRLKKLDLTKLRMHQQLDSIESRKYDSLKIQSERIRIDLDKSKASSAYWVGMYRKAKESKDTGAIFENCDTLISVVENQNLQIEGFEKITDSMITTHKDIIQIKDDQINLYQGLFLRADTTLKQVGEKYTILDKNYQKEVKHNKTNKTLVRILGVIVLALGGLYAAK